MRSRIRNFVYSLVGCLCLVTGGALDAQVVSITSGQPPNGVVGMPYHFTFSATGGQDCSSEPSYDWSATGLPSGGLTLGVHGALTGTPTTSGPITFTVTASNNSCEDQTAQQQYTITISSSGQPANTTAYVANGYDGSLLTLVKVASVMAAPFGTAPVCGTVDSPCFDTDVARDATRGNFIVAAGL